MSGPVTLWAQMRDAAMRVNCDCYYPDDMEFDPGRMCPRCQLIALIDAAMLDSSPGGQAHPPASPPGEAGR